MTKPRKAKAPCEKTSHAWIYETLSYYLGTPADDIDLRKMPIECVRDIRKELLETAREYSADAKTSRWPDDKNEARRYRDAARFLQLEINRDNAWRKRQLSLAL